jgi:signal peptidase I
MNDRLIGQPVPDDTAGGDADRSQPMPPQANAADDVLGEAATDPGLRAISGADGASDGANSAQADESGGADPPGPADQGESVDRDDRVSAKARRRRRSFWRELPVLIIVALAIALLIKTYVVQAFWIPSGSMENTLEIGDKILVNKLVYHFRSIQPGDVVVFDGTGSWENAPPAAKPSSDPLVRAYDATLKPLFGSVAGLFGTEPGQTDFIKRVIGVPGDHVVCCNAQGLVTVNGVPLHEQSYLYPGSVPSDAPAGYSGRFNITVPPGRLWVMGDNRPVSDDSRLRQADPGHGTIPESQVIGRAFMIVWPASRWRILPIPSTFSQPGIDKPTATSASLASAGLASGRVQAAPAAPYLPLAGGVVGAVPLTLLQRRLRVSRWRRRRRKPRPN